MKNKIIMEWFQTNANYISMARAIYRKYPTIEDLEEGCEDAFEKTGNVRFKQIPVIVRKYYDEKLQYPLWPDYINTDSESERMWDTIDKLHYQNALIQFIEDYNRSTPIMKLMIGLMCGGTILGMGTMYNTDNVNLGMGISIGSMYAGLTGLGISAYKNKKQKMDAYKQYQKDRNVDNMLSKL